jgi:hypothetical protein
MTKYQQQQKTKAEDKKKINVVGWFKYSQSKYHASDNNPC